MPDILTEIETGVLARLAEKGLPVGRLAAQRRDAPTHVDVSANAAVSDGAFRKTGQRSVKAEVNLYVAVKFTSFKDEGERRGGVNPILLGVLNILMLSDLGLGIDELVPVRMSEFTDEKDARDGKILWVIQFRTGFSLEKMDDAALAGLLTVGLGYYTREPAGAGADAADTVPLPQG